jgi:hypothetical protein
LGDQRPPSPDVAVDAVFNAMKRLEVMAMTREVTPY